MQQFNNILLFAGETKNENMPVGFYSSLALLPLRGKPVIWWQLENLVSFGINEFIIVVCKNNIKLIKYIETILQNNFNIKLVEITENKNILSSLKYALRKANPKLPTRVILGDTYIPDSISEETDTVFTSRNFTDPKNWCLITKDSNNNVTYFYDKRADIEKEDKEALVGYYTFKDTAYLSKCCEYARFILKQEISEALIAYKKRYTIKTKLIDDWYDLGHTSGIIKAKNYLYNARCFNSISVNTDIGTLTKTSSKISKLEDEAYWFNNLPNELKILAPRFINFQKNNKNASLTQELYGYPSLQELYLSGEVNIEDWKYIIEKLFELHKIFEGYTTKENEKSLVWLYWEKTKNRVDELKETNPYWAKLSKKNVEIINNQTYKGIGFLSDEIEKFAKTISKNAKQTIIHGDYCFSNILFDSSNYIFKLIDPRGRLNEGPTIFGDPRYDIAKLRHSVVGLYDFIVQGMFKINRTEKGFEYKILTTRDYSVLEDIFDNYIKEYGYNQKEIEFIEGLLFLSMIPLHVDNFDRQQMFYVRAVELLNKTLVTAEEI